MDKNQPQDIGRMSSDYYYNDLMNLFRKSKTKEEQEFYVMLSNKEHLKNIFSDGELDENSTCRKFRRVATNGKSIGDILSTTMKLDSLRKNAHKNVSEVE